MNSPTYSIDTQTSRSRPKIGLALSSGGARGLAHVGVIQVLEENGIEVDVIAGASMGAYVGALWAAGYNGRELEAFAAEIRTPRDLWGRLDLALPPVRGLFHGRAIKSRLEEALDGVTFGELERELRVVAANLDTFERKVFCDGDVATAVHASFAIPGICVPVEIGGHRFVDGGIVDPLPIGVLAGAGCERLIGVTVVPSFEEVATGAAAETAGDNGSRVPPGLFRRGLRRLNRSFNVFASGNVVDTLRRSLLGAQIRMANVSRQRADLVIAPSVPRCRWHDYHHYLHYIEVGRRAAESQLPALRALCEFRTMKGGSDASDSPNRLLAHLQG
jgi:NTE family protein